MAFPSEFTHPDGDVRFILKASTVDWVVYIDWVAESIREVRTTRQFLFWTYDHWERQGTPIPFDAFFQIKPGAIIPPGTSNPIGPIASPETGEPGYRVVKLWQLALSFSGNEGDNRSIGGIDNSIVGTIDALRVNFDFDGEKRTVETGANWLTKGIALVALFALAALATWGLSLILL